MAGLRILGDKRDLSVKPILQPFRKRKHERERVIKHAWGCVCLCSSTIPLQSKQKPFIGLSGPHKTYTSSHIQRAESPRLPLPEVDNQGSKRPLQAPSLHLKWKADQRWACTVQPTGTLSVSNNMLLYLIRPPLSWRIPKHFTLFIHRRHFTSHWAEERNNNCLFFSHS